MDDIDYHSLKKGEIRQKDAKLGSYVYLLKTSIDNTLQSMFKKLLNILFLYSDSGSVI